MKLNRLSEAKINVGKPDMLHVLHVGNLYDKYATNGRYATEIGNRPSDQEIWDRGDPVINKKRQSLEGRWGTSLDFVFRNTSEKEANQWVKNFVSMYKIPYTSMNSRPPRGQEWLADDDEIGNRPSYTRVTVAFEEHPDNV